jgi:CheY-like chemotaxis protein
MVYGFVKQSGGHIKIYSEEGHGTTIKLYLPPAPRPLNETAAAGASEPIEGGTKPSWWSRTTRWCAIRRDPDREPRLHHARGRQRPEALQIIDSGERRLLFTDVIMPGGMNGRQLADEVLKRRPGSRCSTPRAIPTTPSCITAGSTPACCC